MAFASLFFDTELAEAGVRLPGLAVADRLLLILVTGRTKLVAEVMKASAASLASSGVNARSSTARPASRAMSRTLRRVMPCRIALDRPRVISVPSLPMMCALAELASVTGNRPRRTRRHRRQRTPPVFAHRG